MCKERQGLTAKEVDTRTLKTLSTQVHEAAGQPVQSFGGPRWDSHFKGDMLHASFISPCVLHFNNYTLRTKMQKLKAVIPVILYKITLSSTSPPEDSVVVEETSSPSSAKVPSWHRRILSLLMSFLFLDLPCLPVRCFPVKDNRTHQWFHHSRQWQRYGSCLAVAFIHKRCRGWIEKTQVLIWVSLITSREAINYMLGGSDLDVRCVAQTIPDLHQVMGDIYNMGETWKIYTLPWRWAVPRKPSLLK